MKYFLLCFLFIFCFSCTEEKAAEKPVKQQVFIESTSLMVLGTVQDGGSPHIGCKKKCCADLFEYPDPRRKVVSLGLVDYEDKKTFILEASPDMPEQMKVLNNNLGFEHSEVPDGIFITHAHIGHYTGLMYLGRESLGGKNVPVHVMPTMKTFLETNGPWDQLVKLENVNLKELESDKRTVISTNLAVQPILVPHRDEYSETVGFKVFGPEKTILFIPDIDKWAKWKRSIVDEVSNVDYAFVDATFYDAEEINNRDISEIPHPFVIETMALFDILPDSVRQRIHFIHLNHTNPLLNPTSEAYQTVTTKGYNVAEYKKIIEL